MRNNIVQNSEINETNKQLLFVEKSWVTGDTCVAGINNVFERAQAKEVISKFRKKFLNRLVEQGFEITYDKVNLPEDTIYFIMNDLAIGDENLSIIEYKKIFDEKMLEAGGEYLNFPLSYSVQEYFDNPFFPAVFKNTFTNGGEDKFLIETSEQLETIKRFYSKYATTSPYKEQFEFVIFQQFIETPTEYATYMRVLMSASGDVMGASLKYQVPASQMPTMAKSMTGIFEQAFCVESSAYFLKCDKMFGYYSGGKDIFFSQPSYNSKEEYILEEHDINPEDPRIPEEVLEVATNIVQNCNKELGILCGLDFIMNKHDGKWYYLENQAFPAIDEWSVANRVKLPKRHDIKGYIKMLEIELKVRYEALMLCMERKHEWMNTATEKEKHFVKK